MNLKNYLIKLKNKFTPIKKDRVIFMSYNGRYSDSPKCIFEMMKNLAPNLECIWLVKECNIEKLPKGTKFYIYDTPEAKKVYNTAHVIIDNVYGDNELYLMDSSLKSKIKFAYETWCNKKKNQRVYSTWHGSAFKKAGIDIPGSPIKDFSRPNLTMILNDGFCCNIFKHLTFNRLRYEVMPLPRNEIFSKITEEEIIILKKKLNLPLDKKVVLFAPTFRAEKDIYGKDINRSGINQLEMIDFDKLFENLKCKFGGEWVFVCRFHYHVSEMIDWAKLEDKYNGKVINGNLSDEMNEYLVCSDVLISDASTCLIDYLLTYKPAFLFFPDMEYYLNQERGGVYYDINQLPFPLAINAEKLYSNIATFDLNIYKEKVKHFMEYIQLDSSQNVTERIAKFILNDSNIEY